MKNKRGSLKYHSGIGQMASCQKYHKISIRTWIPGIFVSFAFSSVFWHFRHSFHVLRFYYPGILVGPHLDFTEYMELINETTFQNLQVKAKVKPGRRLPPGRKRAAYKKMFFGLVYLGVFVLYGGKYNYGAALTSEFMKHSLLMRYLHIYLFYWYAKDANDQSCFLGFCCSSLEDHLNERVFTLPGNLPRYT